MSQQRWSFRSISVLLIASALASSVYADDRAQLKYEKKLDEVYHEYNVQPTDEYVWDYVQQVSGKKNYKTKKGDTLWELSSMIFGDASYWPKVWSINKEVVDPHSVPPGTVLKFTTGNYDEEPKVSIFGVPEWVPPPEARTDVLTHTINAEIPLPMYESQPLLNALPPSLPEWQYATYRNVKIESKIDISARQVKAASPLKYIDSYIEDTEFASEGEVVGTELDMATASEFQYIFVKLNNPRNKKYIVVRDGGVLKDPFAGKKGRIVEVLGQIEVSEMVDDDKHTYRAIVKKSVGQVSVGAKLISGDLPTYQFDDIGPIGTVDARIVGGRFSLNRRLFGTDAIVYLNLGHTGGVNPGVILPIYEYQLGPTNSDLVKFNPRLVGKMKVIKTSTEFSTAVVIENIREIQIGDGTSRKAAPAKSETGEDLPSDAPKPAPVEESLSPSESATPPAELPATIPPPELPAESSSPAQPPTELPVAPPPEF